MTRGGALLGAGGMGEIHTLDELGEIVYEGDMIKLLTVSYEYDPKMKSNSYAAKQEWIRDVDVGAFIKKYENNVVIKLNLQNDSDGDFFRSRVSSRAVSSRAVSSRAVSSRAVSSRASTSRAVSSRASSADAAGDKYDACADELRGNMRLLTNMADTGVHKNKAYLDRASPFYLVGRKKFIAGLEIYDKDGDIVSTHPLYRKMFGDLHAFYKRMGHTISVQHVLDIVMSTLYMLKAMQGIQANHVDIKEGNMLYGIECFSRVAKMDQIQSVKRRDGRCSATFMLSDYGLVLFDGDRRGSGSGTPGMIAPCRFIEAGMSFEEFRYEYASYVLPYSPTAVWNTYSVKEVGKKSRREVYEKSDLYALGVMLAAFDTNDAKPLAPLVRFVRMLVMGKVGRDIWTIDEAFAAYRDLRKALNNSRAVVGVSRRV